MTIPGYAERWNTIETRWDTMNPDEQRAFIAGLSTAYADVFDTFQTAFSGRIPCDTHTIFEHLHAQWDNIRATQLRKQRP